MPKISHKVTFEAHCSLIKEINADHTFVHPVDYGDDFKCWGTAIDDDPPRIVCSGEGYYEVPDDYRCPVTFLGKPRADTAGIGKYLVDGVCQQSANCFLYNSGVTLNNKAKGYWFTHWVYGTYGRKKTDWLINHYEPACKKFDPRAKEVSVRLTSDISTTDSIAALLPTESATPMFKLIHEFFVQNPPSNPHDRIMKECEIVAQHEVPGMNYTKIADFHNDYLKEHDNVVSSNKKKGVELGEEVNEVAANFQKTLAERLDAIHFKKLFAVEPGETCGIAEPDIMKTL